MKLVGEKLPAVGIEPTLREKRDFESRASANSATPATRLKFYTGSHHFRNPNQWTC